MHTISNRCRVLRSVTLTFGKKKMIEKLENIASTLIPKRKWFLIAFLFSLIGAMPAVVGLMILFKNPVLFFLGLFVSVLGFTWSGGLFLISYWYNPNGGPLTQEKINRTHPFFKAHVYVMRFVSPVFLLIWFLCPFVVLAMNVPFIKIMIEK